MKISFNPIYKLNNQIKQNNCSTPNTSAPSKTSQMNGLDCISNYNIPFCAGGPVYAINYDGSYEKIDSASEACKKYNNAAIYSCLSAKTYATGGRVFVYADEIEDKKGEIDFEVLVNMLSNFKYSNAQPVYSIDSEGNIQRFNCAKDMSKKLNITLDRISQVFSQNIDTARNYTFVKAFDVELRDEKGNLLLDENNNPIVDTKAINKAREKFLNVSKNVPIICAQKDGKITRYQNTKEVSQGLDVPYMTISAAISATRPVSGEYLLFRLSDIVKRDKFGDVQYDENNDYQLDLNKISRYLKDYFDDKCN